MDTCRGAPSSSALRIGFVRRVGLGPRSVASGYVAGAVDARSRLGRLGFGVCRSMCEWADGRTDIRKFGRGSDQGLGDLLLRFRIRQGTLVARFDWARESVLVASNHGLVDLRPGFWSDLELARPSGAGVPKVRESRRAGSRIDVYRSHPERASRAGTPSSAKSRCRLRDT